MFVPIGHCLVLFIHFNAAGCCFWSKVSGDLQHPGKIDFRHIDHLRQIFDVPPISNDEKNRQLFQNVYKNSTNNVKTFIAKNRNTKAARCKFDLLNSIRFQHGKIQLCNVNMHSTEYNIYKSFVFMSNQLLIFIRQQTII